MSEKPVPAHAEAQKFIVPRASGRFTRVVRIAVWIAALISGLFALSTLGAAVFVWERMRIVDSVVIYPGIVFLLAALAVVFGVFAIAASALVRREPA